MNSTQIFLLCLCGAFFLVVALIAAIGDHYSLKGIPNKPVGNGQHGTARFATNSEVTKTYKHIPYAPKLWRKGEQLPSVDGLIVGCHETAGGMTALVDDADIHTLMIGASGVGKTANFLYPNIEYCCASGMSFVTTDSKNIGDCDIKQIGEWVFQSAFTRLWNKLQAHYKAILVPMVKQLETLSERERSGNTQLAALRKEISEIRQQIHMMTVLNSQGTLDGAYFKERTQELDRKLLTTQKQLHASLDDENSERLDELRKLIGIFERAEPITEFDEIKFGQIVEKITVLSESEIRFDLIGGIGFTEQIVRNV